jgi:hypothetical protein
MQFASQQQRLPFRVTSPSAVAVAGRPGSGCPVVGVVAGRRTTTRTTTRTTIRAMVVERAPNRSIRSAQVPATVAPVRAIDASKSFGSMRIQHAVELAGACMMLAAFLLVAILG